MLIDSSVSGNNIDVNEEIILVEKLSISASNHENGDNYDASNAKYEKSWIASKWYALLEMPFKNEVCNRGFFFKAHIMCSYYLNLTVGNLIL